MMPPKDLLEAALLDACGLLEPRESAEFERDFAAASADLRAEIRREQARFADLSSVLPDVTPRPELRVEVIAAVHEAIGRTRDRAGERIVHAPEPGREAPTHRRMLSPWRVAAFGFATAAIVMGVLAAQLQTEFNRVRQQIASNEAAQFFLSTTPNTGFRAAVLDSSFQRTSLVASGDTPGAQAAVFYNTAAGEAHAGYFRLPALDEGATYVVVQVGDNGKVLDTLDSFVSDGELGSVRFDFDPTLGTRFAIGKQVGGRIELVMVTV